MSTASPPASYQHMFLPSPLLFLLGPLFATTSPTQDVHGLDAGEHVVTLEPVPAPLNGRDPREDWLTGRVLDAHSGRGLAGVRVRAFGEDYFDPREAAPALAVTTTAQDGTWAIALASPRRADRPARADVEKLLFDRPGWRGTEQAASSASGNDLALFPTQSPAPVAILDLGGRPVAGAVVSTTISCSHAPSSFVAVSDARGIADLGSLPSGWDGGELQVSAPGYGVLDDVDGWDLVVRGIATGRAALFLPRRTAIEARILAETGEPLEGGRVVWPGSPWRVARVHSGGRVVFDSPAAARGPAILYRLEDAGMEHGEPLSLPRAPRGVQLTTRVDSLRFEETWKEPTSAVTVRFVHDDVLDWEDDPRGGSRPAAAFLHESGHSEFRSDRGVHEVPHGAVHIAIGGDFSGWCEEQIELVIDGPRELVLRPRREPRLSLDVAPDMHGAELWVQAGDDSITVAVGRGDDEPVFVPPGRPITLAWHNADGSVHTRVLDALEADRTVRLDSSAPRLAPPFDPDPEAPDHPRTSLVVRAMDTNGLALDGLNASALVGSWHVSPAVETSTSATFEVPAGLPCSVQVEVPGYVTRYHDVQAALGPQVDVVLERLARISIEGEFHAAFIGAEVLSASDAVQGHSLAPGPTRVVLLFADGRRAALDLILGEGAQRRIRVN